MFVRLADLALSRPWALLAGNLGALAAAVGLAAGAPGDLAVGSFSLADDVPRPDLVLATRGEVPVASRVYGVALDAMTSQALADEAVATVGRAGVSRDGRATALEIDLVDGDDGERLEAIRRIEAAIDPGPLRVYAGGDARTLDEARSTISDELWRLELLALPFGLLLLAAAFGRRLAAVPVLAAGLAIAGALAGMRVLDVAVDASLAAIAPAAAVGVALGIELPALIVARFREEAVLAEPAEAVRRALAYGGPGVTWVALAAAAVPFGLLLTPLDQAPSIAVACALAAGLALTATLTALPALIALLTRGGRQLGARRLAEETRAARVVRAGPVLLARSRGPTAVGCTLAVAALAALAAPTLDGASRPFAPGDLPKGTEAQRAAEVTAELRPPAADPHGDPTAGAQEDDSLFGELLPAAALALVISALALVASTRSPRAASLAIAAPLPAAAAAGLLVLVFQDGHLASTIGQERQGAIDTGALASMLVALAAIGTARCVATVLAARGERRLGMPPEAAAQTAAPLVLPAAIAGTLATATATGVLAGSDLVAAREFGLAVAAGLLLDLVLVRAPFLAAAARWGGR